MSSEVTSETNWTTGMDTVAGVNVTSEDNINGSSCYGNCTYSPFAYAERVISMVVPTVFGVVFLLGLLGNTLVILVVASDKNMRNTTNILILVLAVADLLFIIFCVPFTATGYAIPVWPFGEVWCKIVQYLIFVCAYASVYTLVLMSLDRYLAVVHAIRSMSIRNERNTWLAVAVTWIIIMAGHTPLLLQYHVESYSYMGQNRSTCINMWHLQQPQMGILFHSFFITFGYALPLGAVCLMYGLMLKRLHNSAPGGATKSQESMRAKRRVTKMVVIIVVVFAVCWLPIQVILLIQKMEVYPTTIPAIGLQMFANCLAYINSCVNPFLYAFLSENFRRSFRKFLCCSSTIARRAEYELVSVRQSENLTTATAIRS
ncbi:hypothetical protein ACOMHN_041931 [Nucella lapillus]